MPFEVSAFFDAVVSLDDSARFGLQYVVDLVLGPNVELALLSLAIGVLRCVEPTFRARHFGDDVVKDLGCDPPIRRVSE